MKNIGNDKLVCTGGSCIYESQKIIKSQISNPYLEDKNLNKFQFNAVSSQSAKSHSDYKKSISVKIKFQNPETGKNANAVLNVPKDSTIDQLIHQALEQFNSQFVKQDLGMALKMDDNYYINL